MLVVDSSTHQQSQPVQQLPTGPLSTYLAEKIDKELEYSVFFQSKNSSIYWAFQVFQAAHAFWPQNLFSFSDHPTGLAAKSSEFLFLVLEAEFSSLLQTSPSYLGLCQGQRSRWLQCCQNYHFDHTRPGQRIRSHASRPSFLFILCHITKSEWRTRTESVQCVVVILGIKGHTVPSCR